MRRRIRSVTTAVIGTVLVAVPFVGAVASAAAATVPTASCVDGNFFDGLDTRYAASYCANALNAAGYAANAFTNTDAGPALAQESTDAIFYHAGHSLVDCASATLCTALSSVFAGSSPTDSTFTGLLGDPNAAPFAEGPATVCSTGACRSGTLVNYPYETQMAKFNLAVFQSCNSALDGADGFQSLATTAYNLGLVGTAIGFRDAVSWIANAPGDNIAGDAFARTFWADLQNGRTYDVALVDATNAAGGPTYGYSSYVDIHDPTAPNTIQPAQYFVVGAATPAATAAPATNTSTVAATTQQAVAAALGLPADQVTVSSQRNVDTPTGKVIDAAVPGVGIVQLDAATYELREVVYSANLATPTGSLVPQDTARQAATQYAARHFAGLDGLTAKPVQVLDHHSFTEYRYEWQAHAGDAWLPTTVAVGVNARTGAISYYWSQQTPTRPAPAPQIPATTAQTIAAQVAGLGPDATVGQPRLDVTADNAGQHLVWTILVQQARHTEPALLNDVLVHVDAITGSGQIWATT